MGRRGLSRRAVGRVLSVASGAAALAVAGCGGAAPGAQGGAAAGAGAAPATLIFWCRDSQENYEKLQAPMVEYRKRNPHITISDENANMSDTEFNTKLRAAFAGGSGPDAWWSATRLLRPLQAMGAVADLTAAYGKARLTADSFYGNSVEELQIDGKLYGVPQGWGIGLLGLNKTLLQRSGVTLAADFDRTWTQAQMVDTLKRVARSDTEGNLGTWGIEWGTGLTTLSPLLWMHGSDLLDKDKKKTVINAQAMAPASVQALQWWTELTWTHRVQPRRSGPDRPQGVNMWTTGRQALNGNAGPNVLSQWTTLDFEWDVVLRPIGPKGRSHRFYSNAYYAGRESKVKDATWDYLSWAGTDGMEFTEAAGGYNIPGYKKIADAIWAPKKSNNVNRSRFLEAARDGKAQPLVVPWDEMNAAVSRAMEELWDQKVNAKVAIEAMQRDVDALLG